MIVSAFITQLRREVGDMPKTSKVAVQGNGSVNLFNTGKFPIIEGSYSVYTSGSLKTETTNYTLDKDTGDLQMVSTPPNGLEVSIVFKHAHWRDQHWLEAVNQGIEELNAKGFFKPVERLARYLSAGVRTFSAPSATVDVNELLYSPSSGSVAKLNTNWSYRSDSNKIVLGVPPTAKLSGFISYLRRLQPATATSSTLDVSDDWAELVKAKAKGIYFRSLAGKIAKQGNANIDEGHFSFTSLRTQANDYESEFERKASRAKPGRPAKDMMYHIPGEGIA